MVQDGEQLVTDIARQAKADGLWLTWLFFVLMRRRIVALHAQASTTARQGIKRSPFVYDTR